MKEDKITINFGNVHPNPYIKAFEAESTEKQLENSKRLGLDNACLYPSKNHLGAVVDSSEYADKPFTLELALGLPQLSFHSFDLSVLETYRNDPRYYYDNDDIHGSICVSDDYFESADMRKSDQVLLQTFGFSYDSEMNRAVAVYLRYLANLSSPHQQIWKAKMLKGAHKLHPHYYRTTMGEWPEKNSIFTAFIEEIHHVNKISKIMGRPPFFRDTFRGRKRPRIFGFLIRPTLKEFNSFVLILDKMISENINRDFFQNEVSFKEEERRSDGTIVVKPKGSISILDDWINSTIRFPDPAPKNEMISTFKAVRKLRQYPAHSVEEDVFDQKYFKKQRELIISSYKAIRTLRLILKNHPSVANYDLPEWLEKGEIWTY